MSSQASTAAAPARWAVVIASPRAAASAAPGTVPAPTMDGSSSFFAVRTAGRQVLGGCSAAGCPRNRSGLGAVRTGDYPCPDESSELGLRAGGGRTPLARVPGPPDERVLCHVLANLREAPPTVSRAILQLQADLAQRFPLPGHESWSETPVRVTRNAWNGGRQRREVRIPMA